jgi:hypothetical protein
VGTTSEAEISRTGVVGVPRLVMQARPDTFGP